MGQARNNLLDYVRRGINIPAQGPIEPSEREKLKAEAAATAPAKSVTDKQ